ncbi:uncharacterized protein [Typha latifolia]
MAILEVNKRILEELESMGFPTARATRALHSSGNLSIDSAIDWLMEHEHDPDIDQKPLVTINVVVEGENSVPFPEEVKLKAQQLREHDRQKKLEENRRLESEREKERIRTGKEIMEAKRIDDDNRRKRMLETVKEEKEEEKRAREKIRQRLAEDKIERRRKLGLPPDNTGAARSTIAHVEKERQPVNLATRAAQFRDCLRTLKKNHKDDDPKVKRAFQTLLRIVANVAKNPEEEKFRKIRLGNPTFQDRVGSLKGGIEFLELCGFKKLEGNAFLVLPSANVDMAILNTAGMELNSAMANPFFGLLST